MRYLPIILGAGLLSAGLLAGSNQANAAMPTLTLDRAAVADSPIEKVGRYYRRRHYAYRPYYRPHYRRYGYYRPYYGYGYRPYGYYGYGWRPWISFGFGPGWGWGY
jgi:hypothetical protein